MIQDILQELEQIKSDMKVAITNKGVEPTGGLTTYADAIRNIPHSIEGEGVDFSSIGYKSNDSKEANIAIAAQINYSKSIADVHDWYLVGDIEGWFENRDDIVYFPHIDTKGVTNMRYLFRNNNRLRLVGDLDASNVMFLDSMFEGCNRLLFTPKIKNTHNVEMFPNLFKGCASITESCAYDTSNAGNIEEMFSGCTNLKSIPLMDASHVVYIGEICYNCTNLTDVGGFKDLGKIEPSPHSTLHSDNMFYNCNNLTHDSIMNIINNLYDRAANGYANLATIPLGSQNLSRISDEEKAIATNKGWIIR
jgi:hypothetical protein